MNNNNTNNNRQPNNNNRRRGRNNNNNNNRQQQNNRSGFDYQNQIDNRARGNASQMLEKYRKLASDAQLNGDRVSAESYLQFADHYFRVLADFRSRQEARQEERRPRDQERDQEGRDDWRDDNREQSFDENDDGDNQSDVENAVEEAGDNNRREPRNDRPQREPRNDKPQRNDRSRDRAPRRHHSEEAADSDEGSLDLAVLPPSIAIAPDRPDDDFDTKPVRKPRARRPKSANDEDIVTAAE
jgi:Domain of unknown function (DUF4167)